MSLAPPTRSMADVAAYEERMPGQDASERAMTWSMLTRLLRGYGVLESARVPVSQCRDRLGVRIESRGIAAQVSQARFAPFLER